jgi:hypothetical protein
MEFGIFTQQINLWMIPDNPNLNNPQNPNHTEDLQSSFQFTSNEDFTDETSINLLETNGTGWGSGKLTISTNNLTTISNLNLNLPSVIQSIDKTGDLLYIVTKSNGIFVINCTDPYQMRLQATFGYGTNDSSDLATNGKYIFVADGSSGLEMYQNAGASGFTYLTSYSAGSSVREVEASGRFLYIATDGSQIKILNAINLFSIITIKTINIGAVPLNIRIWNSILAYYQPAQSRIVFLNVSNPYNPTIEQELSSPNLKQFEISDNHLVVLSTSNSLTLYDLSNLNSVFNEFDVF